MAALEMNLPLNMVSIGPENVLAALMHRSNQLTSIAAPCTLKALIFDTLPTMYSDNVTKEYSLFGRLCLFGYAK